MGTSTLIMLLFISWFLLSTTSTTTTTTTSKLLDTNLNNLLHSYKTGVYSPSTTSWEVLPTEIMNLEIRIEPQLGLKNLDQIKKLPGQPNNPNINHYSGYVTVDHLHQKALFYYFVESATNSSAKPLILWLNGGPLRQCSSIGQAFINVGPFRVESDEKTLLFNPYSWHNAANMLFLDSPVPVGFSYGNNSDYYNNNTGDISTARDSYIFLLNWLERFPEFKNRELYLAGDFYAGHYVPQLGSTIIHYNHRSNVNFKGIMIGNGWLVEKINWVGMYDNLLRRDLCSNEGHDNMFKECDFSNFVASANTEGCSQAIDRVAKEFGPLDVFNIYSPNVCGKVNNAMGVDSYDPCSVRYAEVYLESEELKQAIHAHPFSSFSLCDMFSYWQDSPSTILPIIKQLIKRNISVLLFSGDVDGYVPPLSTRRAIRTMNLPITSAWHPWYLNNEVGGYVEGYGKLMFVTIRGAGREVSSSQPVRALSMIASFLSGSLK